MSAAELTIGDLAREAGVATHVLRHWKDVGLLDPARNSAGRRRYGQRERERIAIIRLGKRAGLSLEEIRLLLDSKDLTGRRAVLAGRQAELEQQIAAAQQAVEMLGHALTCTHADLTECPVFRSALDVRST